MEESHPVNGTDVVPETIVTTTTILEGHDADPPLSTDTTKNDASINDQPISYRNDDDDDEFGDFNHSNVDQGNQIKVNVDDDDDPVPPVNDPDGTVQDDITTIAPKDETVSGIVINNHDNNNDNNNIYDDNDTNHARQYEPVVRDTPHESFVTPTPPQHHTDGGGDNGVERKISAVAPNVSSSSSSVVNHDNGGDHDDEEDFGDFDAAAVPPVPPITASSTDALVLHHDDLDEMDAFGNFDSVTPPETTVTKEETNNNNNNNNDDEDFGDFDAAPPVLTTSDQATPDDDDDDFGDFDEAPAPTDPMALDDGNPPNSHGVDPIVTKCHHAMSIIFQRYVGEERKTPGKDDDHRDVQIPQFDENEIVTIESVLVRYTVYFNVTVVYFFKCCRSNTRFGFGRHHWNLIRRQRSKRFYYHILSCIPFPDCSSRPRTMPMPP